MCTDQKYWKENQNDVNIRVMSEEPEYLPALKPDKETDYMGGWSVSSDRKKLDGKDSLDQRRTFTRQIA